MIWDLLKIEITVRMIAIGLALGALAWLTDVVWDVYVFQQGSFMEQLLFPSVAELLLRLFFLSFFTGFGIYSSALIARMKKSSAQLMESENRYRNLIESARDVIFTISPEGIITSVNPAIETITGWQPDEMKGKLFSILVEPDDLPHATALFQLVLRGEKPDIFELRIRARDNRCITGEIMLTPEVHDQNVIAVLGIGRDVTERKKIEQSLQHSEARYRDLFENANDLIQSVAPDGKFQYVNKAWQQTLGYSAEEARQLTFFDVIHPDSRSHCMELFQCIMSGEIVDRVEATFVTREGKPVLVEGSVNCSMIGGVSVATRGIFRNITDHRHAEEFINNVLENVDEGFIIIDRDFRITSVNKAYCNKVRLSSGEIVGKHCYEISHHNTQPCYEEGEDCAVQRTFETGEPHTNIHQHYDKDGNVIYIEIKSFPVRNTMGRITSAIEIHNDITEKRKLEEQLRHAQKMEAVGTLAGGIAHDFNNILTAIIGYGSLLQMKMGKADPLRPNVDNILASTERAANLTQSLLAFSRKQVISLKPVDLGTIVGRAEKLLERLIGEDIEMQIRLGRENMIVKADSGQIEQVLINLATNARDAMPKGGTLLIESSIAELDHHFIKNHAYGKPGSYARLCVTDTGQGMDRKTRTRVFEPFFTTKEVGKGTGLGLAIAYGIVKQHGGYINVYSELGTGTTFKLYLPLHSASVPATRPAESSLPQGGTAMVLIAEDDDAVRAMTRSVLEGFGYSVIEASDGEEAVTRFRENREQIQLLILDVIMPRKNGKETYEAIRALNPDIKTLFMSGYTAEIIQKRGMLDSCLNFLSKPVSPRELLTKVSEILKRPDQCL